MFTKLGVFHFANGYSEPFESLRSTIKSKHNSLVGSLVVLPEAFNIRKAYNNTNTECNIRETDLWDLQTVAKDFKLSLVAGMVLNYREGNVIKRYNSAYFVDHLGPRLMCHKVCKDSFEESLIQPPNRFYTYTACDIGSADIQNPYLHSDDGSCTAIGALICIDSHTQPERKNPYLSGGESEPTPEMKRRDRVLDALRERHCMRKLVCVPACVVNDFSGGRPPGSVSELFGQNVVALANSVSSTWSFITNSKGEFLNLGIDGSKNQIETVDLCDVLVS